MIKFIQIPLFIVMIAPLIGLYLVGAGVAFMMVVCTAGISLIVIIPAGLAAIWIFKYLYFGIKYIIIDHPTKEVLFLYTILGVAIIAYSALMPSPFDSYGSDYTPFYPWIFLCIIGGLYGTMTKHAQGQASPAHTALIQYIHQATASGTKKPEIVQTLKANGWADADIATAYKNV